MSQDRWGKLDKGQFEVKEMQCESCINKGPNPMVCTVYTERKPNCVLKVECNCLKFEHKK